MTPYSIEWRELRVTAALAAAALSLLAIVLYFGSAWLAERESAYDRARSALARAASQYRSASDDTAVYDEYASRFRELEYSGMIGEERRLAWIEALQAANRDLKLPTLKYEITPRESVSLEDTDVGQRNLDLHRSTMTLQIGALHEGDVLDLLRSLAQERAGIMEAESCVFVRMKAPESLSYDPGSANLDVTCRVHWYTLEIAAEGDA